MSRRIDQQTANMMSRKLCGVFISLFLILLVLLTVSSQGVLDRQSTNLPENEGTSFFFYQRSELPRDCYEALNQCLSLSSDGVYLIKPDGYPEPFEVYCSNGLDDGGWTVIHRRHDASINFNRSWEAYERGFGFLSQEHWLGNEKISHITNQKKYKLRIDITTFSELSYYVTYDLFRISDSFGNYKIVNAGEYNGTAGTHIQWCPTNTVFTSCKCEGTCADPNCTTTCNNTPACFCPNGFLIDGDDCIPRENCGCFLQEADGGQGEVIKEGEEYVSPGCTKRCTCTNGQISCDDTYQCSSDAVCQEREGLHRCICNVGFDGDGAECIRVSSPDCGPFRSANSNSIQLMQPAGWTEDPFQVTCDSQDGGGWLVFQRRVDSSLNFYKYWNDYKEGFGSVDGNFWLGNDKLSAITSQGQYELRIDFVSKSGQSYYAKYNSFSVGNEGTNYRLTVSGYDSSSTVGYDAMDYHNGRQFTTRDRDNDDYAANCAYHAGRQSAWWFASCEHCDLNAPYSGVSTKLHWDNFPGGEYNIQTTEMKIRPRESG